MSTIVFSTGITPNYLPRAKEFLDSLRAFPQIPHFIFGVDFSPEDIQNPTMNGILSQAIDYSRVTERPKFMLQDGGFTEFVHARWDDETVVVFCDADARFQRSPTIYEIDDFLTRTKDGSFLVGRNKPDPNQSLADEAVDVTQAKPAELQLFFPGYEKMRCSNWGFVVARMREWKRLYAGVCEKWPDVRRLFWNPAMVQWISCYIAQRDMILKDLPPTVHLHGHRGWNAGMAKREDGRWTFNGEVVLFAHAL